MDAIAERTAKLISDYENNIPTLQHIMTEITDSLKGIGLDLKEGTDGQGAATARGFELMSQDTATELNGRFTAVQFAVEEAKQQSIAQTQSLADIRGTLDLSSLTLTGIHGIADETRAILVNSYIELQEIRENTGAVVKPIKEMAVDIKEMKQSIKDKL